MSYETHRAIRETHDLLDYVEGVTEVSNKIRQLNRILISKNRKVKPNGLRKSPLIHTGNYRNTKNTYMISARSCNCRRRRNIDEWFEDSGIIVCLDEHDYTGNTFISSHAIQRAFERAWWYLGPMTSMEERLQAFLMSGGNLHNTSEKDLIKTDEHDVFILPSNVADPVFQKGKGNNHVILSFLKPEWRNSKEGKYK